MSVPDATPTLDGEALRALLALQSGVVSRGQIVSAEIGGQPHDIERMLRRRDLKVLLPGVYVDHTGEPTWLQRAWAAVLSCAPAALAGASALRAENGPGLRGHDDDGPIEVAVSLDRTVTNKPGVRVRRMAGFHARVRWNASPPRVRVEEAVLDEVATLRDEADRIEKIASACRSRMTTAERLGEALAARARFPGRRWVAGVIEDVRAGTCSVLERGYLELVERAHGLPQGERQERDRTATGTIYRDVGYSPYGAVVELDGLLHDDVAQRDRDLERDLETAASDLRTVRLGWGQVFRRPCRTAASVGRVLARGGWTGSVQPCGPGCELAGDR